VARFLEEATPDVGETAAVLGHHWREAGDPKRALGYLMAAAEQAGRGWAKETALRLYREALELVPEDDEELRRELVRRVAITMQAAWHVFDAQKLRARTDEGR
jgi:hypothetical protein